MHSNRMKPLQEIAKTREDDAVARFAEKQRELSRHETRLLELRAYVADYSRQGGGAAQSMQSLQIRRAFVDRLRQIVTIQEQTVAKARLACDAERAHWLAAHRNTEVLEKLTETYRKAEARVEERRTQKETDEQAAQLWRAMNGLLNQ